MFGDLLLWIKRTWKQFWCIHDYQYQGKLDFRYCACTKCGKRKDASNKDSFLFAYIALSCAFAVMVLFVWSIIIKYIKYGII